MAAALRRALLAVPLALLLALPASAAGDFHTLYEDYVAQGQIDGCAFSAAELRSGLSDAPTDVREYDPGFADAIEAALEQRALGCGAAAHRAPRAEGGTRITPVGAPGPRAPHPLAIPAASGDQGLPGVLIVMAVLLAAALAAAALLVAADYYGWDVARWLEPARRLGRRSGERLSDRLWAMRDRIF